MNPSDHQKSFSFDGPKVELHLHLDGSVRITTIADLAQKKNLKLTENNTPEEIRRLLAIEKPKNLSYFLSKISMFIPLIRGDLEAIERISYELCEDEAKENVIYFEARYSPHLLAKTTSQQASSKNEGLVTPEQVIHAVYRGFTRGEKDFGVKVRTILCTITGNPGWSMEVVEWARKFKDSAKIVGIDIAGNESSKNSFNEEEIRAFREAKNLGIHRTVHAGESGPAVHVATAVDKMFAERIGHGYHLLDDPKIFDHIIEGEKNRIHFEMCPYSSLLTNAVPSNISVHPVVQFSRKKVNFSINKDDSTITQKTLDDEYRYLHGQTLEVKDFIKANLNAARSCFLPEPEKKSLIERLCREYGIPPICD